MSVSSVIKDGNNNDRAANVDSQNRLLVTGGSLDGYEITDREPDPTTDPQYFGYEDKEGNWYIMRDNLTTGASRYASGTSDYPTAWTNRASQVYNYVSVEF